jgi:poly(A) polymerase
MIDAGVMAHVLPDAIWTDSLSAMMGLERALRLPADPVRRLAALIGALPEDRIDHIQNRLKLANRDGDHLRSRAKLTDRVDLVSQRAFGRALYGAQPVWVRDAAMLSHVEAGQPDAAILTELCRFIAGWTEPRFPLSGADLQAAGMKPGPEMGRLLSELEAWWVAADFSPDRAACLAQLGER